MDVINPVVIRSARRFVREQEAATATEYAVMLALIIGTAMGAIHTYGTSFLNILYVDICSKVSGAAGS
jgi:Flp pilus assembly pilin Flp